MLQIGPRLAGLAAIIAALVLAPAAFAAGPSHGGAGTKGKERAYAKHCGANAKHSNRARTRTKCLVAMTRLAEGSTASPRTACRGLSHKRVRGEHGSPFARCVREGAKLLEAKQRADHRRGADDQSGSQAGAGDPAADDDGAADDADPADDGAGADDEGADDSGPGLDDGGPDDVAHHDDDPAT